MEHFLELMSWTCIQWNLKHLGSCSWQYFFVHHFQLIKIMHLNHRINDYWQLILCTFKERQIRLVDFLLLKMCFHRFFLPFANSMAVLQCWSPIRKKILVEKIEDMALLIRKDLWHEKFQIMSWIFEKEFVSFLQNSFHIFIVLKVNRCFLGNYLRQIMIDMLWFWNQNKLQYGD